MVAVARAVPEQSPPRVEAAAVLSIIDACTDRHLFGPWFKDRQSWAAWFTFLRVMFGLPLDEEGLARFRQCTGRSSPSPSSRRAATPARSVQNRKSEKLSDTVAEMTVALIE